MRLVDLEPRFVRIERAGEGDAFTETHHYVDALTEAQGVYFLCPKCLAERGQRAGVHMVLCWFAGRGVPDDATPLPGRWQVAGTGYDNLTLSPSIHLTGPGCGWHGYVANGDAS